MKIMEEREAYIGFSAIHGIGPQRFKLLVEFFGSAAKAWSASESDLSSTGLGQKLTTAIIEFREQFISKNYTEELALKSIIMITRVDPEFPKRLAQIPDPPIALYIKGKLPDLTQAIAVVGTRKPTSYGKEITERLTRDLVFNELVIVSGLALGIDGIAHQTTLNNQGRTIAVLGCGVDIIYPPQHKNLYDSIIAQGGAVISEVNPGHTVLKGLFPSRNRIISGLSLGVVVTEGAEDSGSLITARYAAEQGREVFAVPGPITSYLSVGPMKLLKTGAKVVTDVSDILEEFNLRINKKSLGFAQNKTSNIIIQNKRISNNLTADEFKIVSLLSENGEMQFDEIVKQTGKSASETAIILSQIELSGIIRQTGNGRYIIL